MIREKYTEFLKEKEQQKESQQQSEQKQDYFRPPEAISPMKLGIKRDEMESAVELTEQVVSQLGITTASSLETWLFNLVRILLCNFYSSLDFEVGTSAMEINSSSKIFQLS